MKTIRVKSYNKLIEKIINEDSIRLDGDTSDYKGKLKKRITDAIRLAKECKIAAKKARDDGNIVDAEWLEKRAEDYETAAKTWNQDALDDEEDNSADSKDKEPSQSEAAQDAANAAKRAARDAQDAANEAQNNAKKLADAGHDASAAQAAADKAQEKADEAKKAAEEAQEHADEASKAEAAGDKDKAKAEAKAAEDAQNKAEQAANEAKEAAEAASQKTASERAQDAAEAAEEAAKNAQTKAAAAQKKADDLKAEGKDAGEAQAEADKAKEKADQANKAAEESKDHAEKAEKAEKSGDTKTANSEADKAETAADGAKQAANSLSDDSEDGSGGSGDDSDSDGGSSSDSDNDSDSDGSSDSGSDSGDDSDSDGDSSNSSDDDYDDSDDDENQSGNTPVKDLFADEEDIPSMPSKGQQGQKPRDPTVDEIVKQLSKLEGEAKRGAIAGLTDLINKNKNESLAEAFSKGIREFSDEEWDDLNDETIDKINKIKQITTIDDVEGRKAKVKSWADNQVSRQELSDEESQNAQHDILQRRAKEQELDKYNNLSGIKDFELDFEGCIRDQVEMVMQDYLTYDEINPEYELEDVIMKAEVQRMMPDEAIPTIAVFFDKSGSCEDAIPTLNNAIATVKKKYVDTGMCKLDLYYFGDRVAYNDANAYVGGSTEAWPHIIETIKQGDYNNVIVMSDDDIENQNNHGESYTVTGCVWWLWVNGIRAEKCVKELRGMQHNFEGEISAY